MDRKAAVAALLPAIFLYACERTVSPPEPGSTATAIEAASGPEATTSSGAPSLPSGPPAGYTDGTGVNEGYPDLSPTPLVPEAEKTEKGARNVLLAFARAIELKEFDQAWAMLSPGDRQRWSKSDFTKLFAGLGKLTVAVPTGTMEAAAGSSYYNAPVTITANDKDGRPVRIEGEALLRRVNDVDGATPAQLRWHFDRLTLDWTH